MSDPAPATPFRPSVHRPRFRKRTLRAMEPPADAASGSVAMGLCELVAIATSVAFAVPLGELTAASRRSPAIAFARQSAMYLAHVCFGLSYSVVGRAFGRDRTTAAHACRLVEDRRDDPAIDAVLGCLENFCAELRRGLFGPEHAEARP